MKVNDGVIIAVAIAAVLGLCAYKFYNDAQTNATIANAATAAAAQATSAASSTTATSSGTSTVTAAGNSTVTTAQPSYGDSVYSFTSPTSDLEWLMSQGLYGQSAIATPVSSATPSTTTASGTATNTTAPSGTTSTVA